MKVLFIAQEITPYLPETEMSTICRNLPQGIQEQGKEIRTFMPRFGCINERRNQLHEVIRLSGMNLIISDTDHPLIIKVASIQSARMQVYFIDNDDYFSRKYTFSNDRNEYFPDNDERTIFFGRGVLETVRKLRWQPNVVHCHGWFTGLIPLYVKKAFREDPLFSKAKVVYSIYNDGFESPFNPDFKTKALTDGVARKDVAVLEKPDYAALSKLAIDFADGFITVGDQINPKVDKYLKTIGKPVIQHNPETYIQDYGVFYEELLS
ncbi:MAG: glycogen/starch synthase [Bacteroidales bacterium]|jgi:starch synthase|nr:glycogen/starch synthase [Bacteroidales bacterium]